MLEPPSTARSIAKSNKAEYCEYVLTLVSDDDVGDQIDIILRINLTKGGIMKFRQSCPLEHLKDMSAAKENVTYKLKMAGIGYKRCLRYFIYGIIIPKNPFDSLLQKK